MPANFGGPTPTPQPQAVLFGWGQFKPARVFQASTWTEGGQQYPLLGYGVVNLTLVDDGEVWAMTGCGSLAGRWVVANGTFVVTDFSRNRNLSEQSCGPDTMREDDRNAGFLTSSPGYAEQGGSVVLSRDSVSMEFVEGPRATPHAWWPWTLKSATADGATVENARAAATLEFLNDHSARWSFGTCVAGTGPVTELDSASIRVEQNSPPTTCPGAHSKVADALARLMSAERITYELDPPRLAMSGGSVELVFERLDE